ncbi:hypothetical protein BH18ACT13_BH18ACT13_01810 [soil metagenome]
MEALAVRPDLGSSELSHPTRTRLELAELCVHALAQLPDSVRLELGPPENTRLSQIAEAYGVRDRIDTRGDGAFAFVTRNGVVSSAELACMSLGEIVESVGEGASSSIDESRDELLAGHSVVVVTNYPAHYRLPLFQEMTRRLARVGADLHVLFLSKGEGSRPWLSDAGEGFRHEFLSSRRLPIRQRPPLVPSDLEERIRVHSPTIVLAPGFSPFVAHRAARVASQLHAAVGVWSGETGAMPTAQSRARRFLRLRMARRFDFGIAYGARAAVYLRELHDALPVVIGRNTAPALAGKIEPREGTRFELVLVGDLASPRKGVDVAIKAMQLAADEGVRLSVIGGGKLLAPLSEAASGDDRIIFLGPLPPSEVRRRMIASDALLFPTRSDVFGLVLVEAMGAGLLAIVSSSAGAAEDLAVHEQNAIVVDGHDPIDWAGAIARLVADPERARVLGSRARRTIDARWRISHAAEAMLAGLRLGASVRSRPA